MSDKLSSVERQVYGFIQALFNAKPDLALVVDDYMIVFEAKFTEKFDDEQMVRARNIVDIWANLLYEDLGFIDVPSYTVARLGAKSAGVDLSWEDILDIARRHFKAGDRSLIAIDHGVALLGRFKV